MSVQASQVWADEMVEASELLRDESEEYAAA